MELNPEQKQAVATREGAWCVLSAPGSGKSTVICERIRALMSEGVSVNDMVVLTFTAEAAAELGRRLKTPFTKLDRGGWRTFHSLCLRIVSNERQYLPFTLLADPIPEPQLLSKILSQSMKGCGLPRKEFQGVRAYISSKKRQRIDPQTALDSLLIGENGTYAEVYQKYETALRDGGLMDFDSLIWWAVWLLEEFTAVKERWQYKYVLVDEFHDTDPLQLYFLELITEKYKNIFVVSDPCQNIYEFRGTSIDNVLNFNKYFPGAQTITLPRNYRSTPQVVEFVKAIAPIENDMTRNMRTERGAGPQVEYRMYQTAQGEAEDIITKALTNPGNSAILGRTNAQLADFETLCTENDIRYHLLGRAGFWKQAEVQQVVNLCGFALSSREPKGYSQDLIAPIRGGVKNQPARQAVDSIIKTARLENLYSNDDFEDDDNFALSNLRKLVQIADRFTTLADFIRHAQKAYHASKKNNNALTLSTVHQAKGLQWVNVFVVGVQDGLMPHKRGNLEEERRVFYVACSRAADRLHLSWSGTPSPFLADFLTPEIKQQLESNVHKVDKIERQQRLFQEA